MLKKSIYFAISYGAWINIKKEYKISHFDVVFFDTYQIVQIFIPILVYIHTAQPKGFEQETYAIALFIIQNSARDPYQRCVDLEIWH